MNPSSNPFFFIFLLLIILLLSTFLPKYICSDERYSNCAPFSCGNITNIRYPFWGNNQPDYCGHPGFQISCDEEYATLDIINHKYRVLAINPSTRILKIARTDLSSSICLTQFFNTTLNYTPFVSTEKDEPATLLYDCDPVQSQIPNEFPCPIHNIQRKAYFISPTIKDHKLKLKCKIIIDVPVLVTAVKDFVRNLLNLAGVLDGGFEVRWQVDQMICINCEKSGGRCGYNRTENQFKCFCPDQAYAAVCGSAKRRVGLKVAIGICGAIGGGIIVCIIGFFLYRHRKRKLLQYAPSSFISRSIASDPSLKSDIEKGSHYFGVHLFTYEELEEATNNFASANELGDGGFGTVYYGKLRDKRVVAVKRLYENNYKRVEQFLNEVDILTRLRHHNLVSLYGCTSRHSRELLLVYEYISNGTVADHLHGEKAKPGELPWDTRMKIAVETATALVYLHASDIIHRDVKTNNILLDDNFVVKVADFGLSRLFPLDVTHVSTAPQGTPGYVDPEYHECYQLTVKSDVYSFGVVLIELISSLPAVDITRHRHEINLSNMAINKIQGGALCELVDKNLGYESDYKVRKMMNAVAELAFQCLQAVKEMRPSMQEVLASLREIQSTDFDIDKSGETDCLSDDIGLLKSGPLPLSPDSVTVKWNSSSTTSNASG